MGTQKYFAYVAVIAIATYLIRTIPLVAIKGKISNRFLNSFLSYMPFAVLGAMTFPAILFSTESYSSAIAAFAAAVMMAFFGKGLIQVAALACSTAFAVEVVRLYFIK